MYRKKYLMENKILVNHENSTFLRFWSLDICSFKLSFSQTSVSGNCVNPRGDNFKGAISYLRIEITLRVSIRI